MNWSGLAQVAIAGVMVGGLAYGTLFGVSTAVDYAVAADAERRARNWAEYMVTEMPDMDQLIRRGQPTDIQYFRIWQMERVGDVFRFKLFDANGKIILVSDAREARLDPEAWVDEGDDALGVLASGRTKVNLFAKHDEPNKPDTYAEAYVPVPDADGNIIGVVEVYLDQTPLSKLFHSVLGMVSMLLAGVFALVFGGAFAGFLIKNRQAAHSLKQIDFLAQYDPLTGLLNRSGFGRAAKDLIETQGANGAVAVLCLDIDNFKAINEARSHRGGDVFLRHVGKAIRQVMENGDVAARLSGDEFVILTRRAQLDATEVLAQRLLLAVARPVEIDGATVSGTVSIGIHFAIDGLPLETRLQRADLALLQAKYEGRNCHRVFSVSLEKQLARRRYLETAIASGLAEDRFFLVYQPLLNRQDGRCAGFEALLRLKDADGSIIPPSDFIPVAESMDRIDEIGSWVLESAMRTAVGWPDAQFVSVNLSVNQFSSGKLVERVRRLLEETGLPPTRLELEVTETIFISDADSIGDQLGRLRGMGISIAMDDFGTGFSSLGYLWRFGFDKLKIDRSFIEGIEHDMSRARDILGTIVTLGHRLEMKVTAEGIETQVQADLLSELDCDQFQGFFFGKPMPDTELAAFLMSLTARTQQRPPEGGEDLARTA